MSRRINQIVMNIIANIAFWVGVGLTYLVSDSTEIRNFAIITAFGCTAALWIIMALNELNTQPNAETAKQEKAKRGADDARHDPRLALLLEVMTDDERRALQARLLDDLDGDGEIPLADLLAVQDDAAAHGERES